MINKYEVEVTTVVEVTLDSSKFTDEFNDFFNRYMFPNETLEDHAKHLAQMEAREMIGFDYFVEGYGDIREMGIKCKVIDQNEEVI